MTSAKSDDLMRLPVAISRPSNHAPPATFTDTLVTWSVFALALAILLIAAAGILAGGL
jgi:hypothetical protein